jgi:hypothetical protein
MMINFSPAIIKKDERITLICHIVYRRVAGGPPLSTLTKEHK